MDKLDLIEQIANSTPKDVIKLLELSTDDDAEIRYRAFEELFDCLDNSEVLNQLEKGLKDSDELVRMECVELLGDSLNLIKFPQIFNSLEDQDLLVRGTTAIAISKIIFHSFISHLLNKLSKNIDGEERVRYLAAFALICDEYFNDFVNEINSENYRIRSCVVNLLMDLPFRIKNSNLVDIFQKRRKIESSEAVKSTIDNALRELKSR